MINFIKIDEIMHIIFNHESILSRKEEFLGIFKKFIPYQLINNIMVNDYFDFSLNSSDLKFFLVNYCSEEIKTELLQAYGKVSSYLNYNTDIQLLVLPLNQSNTFYNTHMDGIVAHIVSKRMIVFYINFRNDSWYRKLWPLFIHEYQHIISSKLTNKVSLLDKIIDEGRSELLVKETIGQEYVGTWATKYSDNQFIDFLPLVNNYKNTTDMVLINDFLNGSSKNNIPLWFGYSLGYRIISDCRKQKENKPFVDLIKVQSEVIYNNFIGEYKW